MAMGIGINLRMQVCKPRPSLDTPIVKPRACFLFSCLLHTGNLQCPCANLAKYRISKHIKELTLVRYVAEKKSSRLVFYLSLSVQAHCSLTIINDGFI